MLVSRLVVFGSGVVFVCVIVLLISVFICVLIVCRLLVVSVLVCMMCVLKCFR